MQVVFAPDVIADRNSWNELDHILYFFTESRHIWSIDDVDEMIGSKWLDEESGGRASRYAKELIEKSYTAFIYRYQGCRIHEKNIIVTNNAHADNELMPKNAVKCLQAPAHVLVENSSSDGAFLNAMANAMKREELKKALANNWVEINTLGGFGDVEKVAEQMRDRTNGPMRVLVMVDSDRLYPGHEDTDSIKKARKYCDTHPDVPCVILWKRKIENYLPISILPKVRGHNRWKNYQAFLHLNQEQRDYYEMKRGFRTDLQGNAIIPAKQNSLYDKLSKHVLRDLCLGFGDKVWKHFEISRDEITEYDVEMTCTTNPGEIKNLLDEIESLL